MRPFKVSSIPYRLFLVLALLSLSACRSPEPEEATRVEANYNITRAEGKHQAADKSADIEGKWKVQVAHRYRFTACFEDQIQQRETRGILFQVTTPEGASFDKKTDNQGCIHWHDRVVFNYFAPEATYVLQEYRINPMAENGKSIYQGERVVPFAVNPWAPSRSKIDIHPVWLKNNERLITEGNLVEGKESVRKALGGEEQGLAQLWMNDLKLQTTKVDDVQDGHYVELDFRMRPSVSVRDIENKPVHLKVPDASFQIFSHLVSTEYGGDKPFLLTAKSPPTAGHPQGCEAPAFKSRESIQRDESGQEVADDRNQVNRNDGFLRFCTRVVMHNRVKKGRFKLLMRIVGLDGPPLQNYENLYVLGEFDSLRRGTMSPMLDNGSGSGFSYSNYLSADNIANFAELENARLAFRNEPFLFSTMSVNWETVAPGETATTRTVEYRGFTCLTDSYNGRVVRNERFKVRVGDRDNLGDKDIIDVETDHEGCLRFNGAQFHRPYKSERLFYPLVEIWRVADCPANYPRRYTQRWENSKCAPTTLEIAINPWDDKFTFARDKRVLTEQYIEELERRIESDAKIPSRFFLAGYGYETLGFQYDVDQFMNVKVRKQILLYLTPFVLRYNSIVRGRKEKHPLNDGLYLLKVAMQKEYLDPANRGAFIDRRCVENKRNSTTNKIEKGVVCYNQLHKAKDLVPREYVTAVKKVVRVQNGTIITPVVLTLRDLRLMRVRTNFFIQMETLDERLLRQVNMVEDRMGKEVAGKIESHLKELDDQRGEIRDLQKEDATQDRIRTIKEGYIAELKQFVKNYGDFIRNEALTGEEENYIQKVMGTYGIDEDDIKALERYDFTVQDPTSSVDYNEFLDHDSGLASRTFVGPLTLLLNGNGSRVRPTDTLDPNYRANYIQQNFERIIDRRAMRELDDEERKISDKKIDAVCDKSLDCNQLWAWEVESDTNDKTIYEKSPFFGDIRHMHNWQVEYSRNPDKLDLIDKLKLQTAYYHQEMKMVSMVDNYARLARIKYVNLNNNEPLKRYILGSGKNGEVNGGCQVVQEDLVKDPDLTPRELKARIDQDFENCLVESTENQYFSNNLVEHLNQGFGVEYFRKVSSLAYGNGPYMISGEIKELLSKKVDVSAMRKMVRQGFVPEVLGARLCGYFTEHAKAEILKRGFALGYETDEKRELHMSLFKLYEECLADSLDSSDGHKHFFLDKKYRVYSTGDYRFRGGKSMNVNVGVNLSLQHAEASTIGRDIGVNFISLIPGIGWAVNLYSAMFGGVKTGISINRDWRRTKSDGTFFTDQTFLAMQTAALDIELKEYDQCLIVSLDRLFALQHDLGRHLNRVAGTDEEKSRLIADAFRHGLFFCLGTPGSEKPIPVRERYYYFTQFFTEGDILDSGDLYNHPWLLGLRGVRDFRAFLRMIREPSAEEDDLYRWFEPYFNKDEQPLGQLNKAYFNVLPSFPGLYTVITDETEMVTDDEYPFPSAPTMSLDLGLNQLGVGVLSEEIIPTDGDPEAPPAQETRELLDQQIDELRAKAREEGWLEWFLEKWGPGVGSEMGN